MSGSPASPFFAPNKNSSDDTYSRDVIGNKEDSALGHSVIARLETGYQHVHQPSKVYPTMALGEPVQARALDGGAWQLTEVPVQIVPADTITTPFDIHWVYVEDISANGVYELVLYKGAAGFEEEIARVRFVRIANLTRQIDVPIQVPVQDSNTRISAAVACSAGDNTATISLYYHPYTLV